MVLFRTVHFLTSRVAWVETSQSKQAAVWHTPALSPYSTASTTQGAAPRPFKSGIQWTWPVEDYIWWKYERFEMCSHLRHRESKPLPGISKTWGTLQHSDSQEAGSKHLPTEAAQLNGQERRTPASNAWPVLEKTDMNVHRCAQRSKGRSAILMSNGLTLVDTAYYCTQNRNDSAILVFSTLLSEPVGIFPKTKKKKC